MEQRESTEKEPDPGGDFEPKLVVDVLKDDIETKKDLSKTAIFFATFSFSLCLLSGIIGMVFVGIGAQTPNGHSLAGFSNVTGTTAQLQKFNFIAALVLFCISAGFCGVCVLSALTALAKSKEVEKEEAELEEDLRNIKDDEAASEDTEKGIPADTFTVKEILEYEGPPNLYASIEEQNVKNDSEGEFDSNRTSSLFVGTTAFGKLFSSDEVGASNYKGPPKLYVALEETKVQNSSEGESELNSLFVDTTAFGKWFSSDEVDNSMFEDTTALGKIFN